MSAVIRSLFISCVESVYDSDYIMDAFYNNNIASVNRVTLLPLKTTNGDYNRAYIDVAYWHDNEGAYNFIQRLKNPNVETRLVHSDDFWWNVQINNKNNITHSKKYNDCTYVNYLLEEDNDTEYDDCMLVYNLNEVQNNVHKPVEIKTNALGAKLLAYINMSESELEWFELQKELNRMSILLQKQEYEY